MDASNVAKTRADAAAEPLDVKQAAAPSSLSSNEVTPAPVAVSPQSQPNPQPDSQPDSQPDPRNESAAPSSTANLSSVEDRMAQLDAALGRAPKKKVTTEQPQPAQSHRVEQPNIEPVSHSHVDKKQAAPVDDAGDDAGSAMSHSTASAAPSTPLSTPPSTPPSTPEETVLELTNDQWPSIIRKTELSGLTLQLAMNSAVKSYEAGVLSIELPMAAQHLQKPATIQALGEQLSAVMGETLKVKVSATKSPIVTPTLLAEQAAQEAQKQAERSIENDPLLAELLNRVDGEVTKNSVRPVNKPVELTSDNGET